MIPNQDASAAPFEFCDQVQTKMYVSLTVNIQSNLIHFISIVVVACAVAVAHRNLLFHLYQRNTTS